MYEDTIERRRKANKVSKKKGRSPTKKHLFLLGWELYVDSELLPSICVRTLYSLGCQIELVFKTWKSYNGLSELRGRSPERIESFIYGRLILLTIMAFLSSRIHRYLWYTSKREASFMKILHHFKVKASKILSLIRDTLSFCKFMWQEFLEASRLCGMELRKRLSTLQKMMMISDVNP
ncbi:MAG: transposase [Candidatus Poribacteria bacterium]